jgi:hypothetical protein
MPEKPLPELPPEMLLSASACRELEAARQDHYMPAQRAPRVARERAESASQYRARGAEADPGYFDIEALDAPPTDDGNDITFDTGDSDIEFDPVPERHASGGGVGGGRFNVLRPPVHEPFRPQFASGPQGGRMVEVGRTGRFAILAEQDRSSAVERESTILRPERPAPRTMDLIVNGRPVHPLGGGQAAAAQRQTAQQIAQRQAIHQSLPTAYDRLLGDDPYDDDLE